jgi:hypothetical protein
VSSAANVSSTLPRNSRREREYLKLRPLSGASAIESDPRAHA